jgi:hypothetical protein
MLISPNKQLCNLPQCFNNNYFVLFIDDCIFTDNAVQIPKIGLNTTIVNGEGTYFKCSREYLFLGLLKRILSHKARMLEDQRSDSPQQVYLLLAPCSIRTHWATSTCVPQQFALRLRLTLLLFLLLFSLPFIY